MRLFILIISITSLFSSTKISDITSIVGVRDNQLIGYGLIVGLSGTGDSASVFTNRALSNILMNMNINISPNEIKSKNIAAVLITAKLNAFARQGDKIDILVSSIGDAKSIEGGTLIMTPLKAVDGKIYALAQGSISIGGKNEKGNKRINHTTGGIVFNGATIERELSYDLYSKKDLTLSLKEANFANAFAIQNAINNEYSSQVAIAVDAKTIRLQRPENISTVAFLASLDNISIYYKNKNKIIINERTGTIVAGLNVKVLPIVITHGDITIKIEDKVLLKDNANKLKKDSSSKEVSLRNGINTVSNIARTLKKLGASAKDIIAILESMKKAGAIKAELEII